MIKLLQLYRKYRPLRVRDLRIGDLFSPASQPYCVYVLTRKDYNGNKDYCIGVCPNSKHFAVFDKNDNVIKRNALCIVQ